MIGVLLINSDVGQINDVMIYRIKAVSVDTYIIIIIIFIKT